MRTFLWTVLALSATTQTNAIDGAAIFAKGSTYEEFVAMADSRPAVWKDNTSRARPSAALVDRLKKAGEGLRFIVVATAACSDSVHTVPYIAVLARESGVPLRIVDPAFGKTIQDAFKTPDGRGATPTVAILRGDKVVGAWVERPVALQTWMLGPAASLNQKDRMDRKFGWYEWDRGESTISELVDVVERSAVKKQ
jgi:hypothetical protein